MCSVLFSFVHFDCFDIFRSYTKYSAVFNNFAMQNSQLKFY